MLTHWTVLTGTLSSSARVCSAMLTIVLSKITARPPAISTRAVTIALRGTGGTDSAGIAIPFKIQSCTY